MTTDAKIGLLLGLVFIVIIAFVINGLPSFNKSSSSNDLTNNYVTQVGNEPIGLADSHRQGLESMNGDTNAASPQIVSAADNTSPASITQVNNVIETQLPVDKTSVATALADSANPDTNPTEETLLPIEATQTQADMAVAQMESEKVQAASGHKSTIHIVKKGDNLGQIAQNYYGTQGAKKENISKIVKANRLKSDRQIYVGQKLVIPSPSVLSESKPSMFETVQSIGVSLASADSTKDTAVTEKGSRDYVVKSGDYPWKIAARELGSGTRYKEIFKCNPNITENTKLSIGMHLKLPQR
jgi:nucleoid-associated protein YgaU